MHKFKDGKGREWQLALTYGLLEKVKHELEIDLLDLQSSPQAVAQVRFNIPVLVNLLYFCLGAKQQGIAEEDFYEGFAGDTFDEAHAALQDEYVDFFPQSQRPALREALGKMTATMDQALTVAMEEINSQAMTTAMQTTLDELRTSIRGHIATASKESLA